MRRNFLLGLILCLIPLVLSGVLVGNALNKESRGEVGFRRGIDLAGGTILVYEVDRDKAAEKQQQLTNEDIKQLAEKLKRRIDPVDSKNVIVRPVGDSRVEIILPFAGSTGGGKEGANAEYVEEVRNLVKQAGVLEFRILANQFDDVEAFQDAQNLIDEMTPEVATELAQAGKLPPVPDGIYEVAAAGDKIEVRYEWVEMGQEERESLHISERFANPETTIRVRGQNQKPVLYSQIAATRGKTYTYSGTDDKNRPFSFLIFSRKFEKLKKTTDEEGKNVEYFVLTRVSPLDALKVAGDVRVTARSSQDSSGGPAVGFSFNGIGASKFGDMTERNKPGEGAVRSLAIVMDDKIVSAPTLQAVLRDGGIISGSSFDQKAVNQLVNILRSGNLNAELKPDPVSQNSVGATLGQTTINNGLVAMALSFAAVLIFMLIYYQFAGLVAVIALFANLLITVGFMVGVNAAFTLPGLAGLVLTLGMAVDANILIYERIREEREKGANLLAAIRNGYDRALPTILDTHLTSIFTAVVLYTFGNDNLKGFSVSLTLGLLISLFTAMYMTRLIFDYATHKRILSKLNMFKLFARPKFDFMKLRKPMFAFTAIVTVLGLALFVARGEKGLNVDFTKGTAYGGRLIEGQERSLIDTDGKLGFLTLLSEDRQKERLQVKDVIWLTKEVGEETGERRTTDNIYKLIYSDGQEYIVTLANLPEGTDEAAQKENLKQRASALPDVSVEQVFMDGDDFAGSKSRSFTIRTTEKEPEIVQACLDRLLRDEQTNESLMDSTKVTDVKYNGAEVLFSFDKPTSPGYFKRFIDRQTRLLLAERTSGLTTTEGLEVTGVTNTDPDLAAEEGRAERYRTIRVNLGQLPEFKPLNDPMLAAEVKAELEGQLKTYYATAVQNFEARPLPDRLETFDPALAADTRNKAMFAVLASWLAIMAYLWFRFGSWQFGLAAVLCLIHDLCFTLGAIAICHYIHANAIGSLLGLQDFKIDLACVAALLTLVGYSVNDTIVVFDRIREIRGKNPTLTPQMINDSVNGTLSRTVLASLAVFLVVAVLYFFGGEGVHLFSFVMVVGVIVGTYSSIYIASPLLLIFGEGATKELQTVREPVSTAPAAIAD